MAYPMGPWPTWQQVIDGLAKHNVQHVTETFRVNSYPQVDHATFSYLHNTTNGRKLELDPALDLSDRPCVEEYEHICDRLGLPPRGDVWPDIFTIG